MNAKPVMIPKIAVPAATRYARIGFALLASTVIFAKELGFWAAIHPVAALGLFLNSFLVLRDSLMKQLPSDSVGE